MTVLFERECSFALRSVSEAADYLMSVHGTSTLRQKTESHRDLVTEHDLIAEGKIQKILLESNYPIVGEESFKSGSYSNVSRSGHWLVDPIDGTVNYLNGLQYYGPSVGLRVCDEFPVGAVSLPALKELYFTYGEASYLNGKLLKTEDRKLENSLVVACLSSSLRVQTEEGRKAYEFFGLINENSRGVMRIGSAATSLCFLADSRFQAVYGFNIKLWDVAAGLAVAGKAGCTVVAKINENSCSISFVAGTKSAVDQIIKLQRVSGISFI